MIRNFDEELVEDREIRIGGEVFEFIYPHWEVGAAIFDEELTPEPNGNGEPQAFSWKADTEKVIAKIPMFLNPKNEAHKRFKALVARKTDAVPRFQLVQLYQLLVQVTSNLPTNLPSSVPSDDGGGTTEPESSDATPSTEATSTA